MHSSFVEFENKLITNVVLVVTLQGKVDRTYLRNI